MQMHTSETLARRALEDAGFKVHDANVIFGANCPNIDLVVFGAEEALYVQVKSSRRPAGKDCILVEGSPWTASQLYESGPLFNKALGFIAKFVVLVDLAGSGGPCFYIVPPHELERAARRTAKAFAAKPKKDGTPRSISFRKELPTEKLEKWRNAWHLLGRPRHVPIDQATREWLDAPRVGRELI
jgi:hypothetical protein